MKKVVSKIGKVALSMAMVLSALTLTAKAETLYPDGYTLEKDETSPSGYTAHFVIDENNIENKENIKTVSITGPFQYVKPENIKDPNNRYTPDQYENGMYATNCAPGSFTWGYTEEMTYDNGKYSADFPVTSGSFAYSYVIEYDSGETLTIDDPANPSPAKENPNSISATGDLTHSIAYGAWDSNKQSNSPNLDYVLPTTKNAGKQFYEAYQGLGGVTQYLGIYLPYNYDASRAEPYKVIYMSHGGGGNETDWFAMGHVDNIMDNLINSNQTEGTIIVTMDNTYYGWDYKKIEDNVLNYIIPHMEKNYNVSTNTNDRAFCGLSMGGMTTTNMYFDHPDQFGYFGIFSGTDMTPVNDKAELRDPIVMAAVGTCDIASSNIMPNDTEQLKKYEDFVAWATENKMTNFVDGGYLPGSHDWFVWSQCFEQFVTKVLWTNQASDYEVGVTIENNTNSQWAAPYQATFVYEDQDDRDVVSVGLTGGFQFYKPEEVTQYNAAGDNSAIPCYDVYEYQEGMFASGYGINNDSVVYPLIETKNERFEITIPLPANLYYYDYVITYADGTSVTIQDPSNPSLANTTNGHDAGHSLLYVGDSITAPAGQEYVYPRTDGKVGTYSFITYDAIDGTKQPLGVYLPYNYDENKTYKTIYVSHGGGGNENEWMTIGAIPNIMDNLIANGEMAEAIVVTMDNTYFNWDYEQIVPNVVDYIIPYIESHYSVSDQAIDRAFCGLSMGAMTTNTMLRDVPEEFGYYGAFSGGNQDLDVTHYNQEAMQNTTLYLTSGCIDMAYNNNLGISSVDFLAMLDQLNVDYTWELKNGAHDWYVWRDSFTTFAKDILWNVETSTPSPEPDPDVPDEIKDTPTSETVKTEGVNTGDYTPIFGFAGLAAIALISGVCLSSKKRRKY